MDFLQERRLPRSSPSLSEQEQLEVEDPQMLRYPVSYRVPRAIEFRRTFRNRSQLNTSPPRPPIRRLYPNIVLLLAFCVLTNLYGVRASLKPTIRFSCTQVKIISSNAVRSRLRTEKNGDQHTYAMDIRQQRCPHTPRYRHGSCRRPSEDKRSP